VRGIAHLVASSVPGLKTSNVTITGASGQLLWPSQGSGEGGEGASMQAANSRYDQQMASTVDAMLGQTLGPGKAYVQVYANLNVNQTTQEQLTYGKAGVPLQQAKNIETLRGNGSGGGGAAGTAAIPTYAQSAGGNSNYKHEVTQTTLGVDKTVTHSTIAPGQVSNEHISVLLDKSVKPSSVPAIREAVANAAGVEAKRGDTISIAQIAFSKAPTGAPTGTAIMGYAKDVLLGLAAIAFLFFTTRFLRKRERDTIEHEPVWLRELERPMRLAELEREVDSAPVAAHNGAAKNGSLARKQVEELAASSPGTIAQQLRTWMREE
jgi:flagellar M-ring protein FliF